MVPMTEKQRNFIADIEEMLGIKYVGKNDKWQARDWISAHIEDFKLACYEWEIAEEAHLEMIDFRRDY